VPAQSHSAPGAAKARQLWVSAHLNTASLMRLDKLVDRYNRMRKTYVAIQQMRRNGVPAPVVFALHYREADNDTTCSPAQGDPLTHKSVHVPKGRIPGQNPPYTFLEAAEDAYYSPELDHLDANNWSEIGAILWNCETFNGLGYFHRGLVSPYVWSGTQHYSRGKYVADGRFDPTAVDKQLGCAAVLKRLQDRGMAQL
jgi:lysozyme family protein